MDLFRTIDHFHHRNALKPLIQFIVDEGQLPAHFDDGEHQAEQWLSAISETYPLVLSEVLMKKQDDPIENNKLPKVLNYNSLLELIRTIQARPPS